MQNARAHRKLVRHAIGRVVATCLLLLVFCAPVYAQYASSGLHEIGSDVPPASALAPAQSPQNVQAPVPGMSVPPPGVSAAADPNAAGRTTMDTCPPGFPNCMNFGATPAPEPTLAPTTGKSWLDNMNAFVTNPHSCDHPPEPAVLKGTVGAITSKVNHLSHTFIKGSFNVGATFFWTLAFLSMMWFLVYTLPSIDSPWELGKQLSFKFMAFATFLGLLYWAAGAFGTGRPNYDNSAANQIIGAGGFSDKVASAVSGQPVDGGPGQASLNNPEGTATVGGCIALKYVELPIVVGQVEAGKVQGNPLSKLGQLMETYVLMLVMITFGAIAAIIALAGYLILAGQLFVIQFNGVIVASAGVFLLGFQAAPWFQSYAQAYWGFLWNVAIQQFVIYLLAIFVSIFSAQIQTEIVKAASGGIGGFLGTILNSVLALVVIALVCYSGPKMASSFLSGQPGMGFPDLANAAGRVGGASMKGAEGLAAGLLASATGLGAAAYLAKMGMNAGMERLGGRVSKPSGDSQQSKQLSENLSTQSASKSDSSGGMKNVTPKGEGLNTNANTKAQGSGKDENLVGQPGEQRGKEGEAAAPSSEDAMGEGAVSEVGDLADESAGDAEALAQIGEESHASGTGDAAHSDTLGASHGEGQAASADAPGSTSSGAMEEALAGAASAEGSALSAMGAEMAGSASMQTGGIDGSPKATSAASKKPLNNIAAQSRGLGQLMGALAKSGRGSAPQQRQRAAVASVATALATAANAAAKLQNPAHRAAAQSALANVAQSVGAMATTTSSASASPKEAFAAATDVKSSVGAAAIAVTQAGITDPGMLTALGEAHNAISAEHQQAGADLQAAPLSAPAEVMAGVASGSADASYAPPAIAAADGGQSYASGGDSYGGGDAGFDSGSSGNAGATTDQSGAQIYEPPQQSQAPRARQSAGPARSQSMPTSPEMQKVMDALGQINQRLDRQNAPQQRAAASDMIERAVGHAGKAMKGAMRRDTYSVQNLRHGLAKTVNTRNLVNLAGAALGSHVGGLTRRLQERQNRMSMGGQQKGMFEGVDHIHGGGHGPHISH